MTRNHFTRSLLAAGAALTLTNGVRRAAADPRRPVILVVSSWQSVNIGDVAHTPGLLCALEKHLPDAEVILWGLSVDEEKAAMLTRRWPDLQIVRGNLDDEGRASGEALQAAIDRADLLLHGSGPSFVAFTRVRAWHRATGKPFGLFGVTLQAPNAEQVALLNEAAFIFTRETHSIEHLRERGVKRPEIGFAPDATFAMDLKNDDAAEAFLSHTGLIDKPFICCIPRLRYTPYHLIRRVPWSEEEIARREAVNAEHAEPDHAKMRAAMIRWVRETGQPILVCPEMTYQLDVMDELLVAPLPEDVRAHVVQRDSFWLPDEAASVYAQARAVLSFECHSPIISLHQGIPSCYLRQPEDTIKGQMYYDLDLSDWVFEIEDTEGAQVADRLMEIEADHAAATAKVTAALAIVDRQYRTATGFIGRRLAAG